MRQNLRLRALKNFTESREAALFAKERHFYTGKKCRRGHDNLRYTSTGNCVDCVKEKNWSKSKNKPAMFYYPLHPSDHEKAMAYCQALDIDRGRMPYSPGETWYRHDPAEAEKAIKKQRDRVAAQIRLNGGIVPPDYL